VYIQIIEIMLLGPKIGAVLLINARIALPLWCDVSRLSLVSMETKHKQLMDKYSEKQYPCGNL